MFEKVLIVDDLASINTGVLSTLENLEINHIDVEQYCDSVYLKVKKGIQENDPYELLITDLSFQQDYRVEKFNSGEELIGAIKEIQPTLKVIVYSVEDRIQRVRNLIKKYNIDSYVCKGRRGLLELEKAVKLVSKSELFFSHQIERALNPNNDLDINDYDIEILKYLSNGLSQDDICVELKKKQLKPNSLSSIEKKLNRIKDQFRANNTTHLISIVKDLGLI